MIKRFTSIALTLIIFSLGASAQTLDWMQTVEATGDNAIGVSEYDISVNEFGEALVMGPFDNIENYNHPFGTIKIQVYSEMGVINFEDTYQGKGRIIDMVSHGDYFYVIGEFLDFIEFTAHPALTGEGEFYVGGFILKMHRTGEVIWVHDTAEILPEMTIYSMDIHSDGTLYIGAGTFAGNSKIIQMDGSGEVTDIWNQTNIGLVSSISVNEAGDVSIAGACIHDEVDFNGTTVELPFQDYNIYVAHYNSEGTYQWSHMMLDVTCPMPQVLLKDNGSTYFAGDLPIETTLGDFNLEPSGWVYSIFHAQISQEGEVLWAYQPEQTEGAIGDAYLASGQSMVNWGDNVILGGFTRGSLQWGEGVVSDSEIPGQSFFMGHFQPDGNIENLVLADDASFTQTVLSMSEGPDGSLYMIGHVYDTLRVQGQELSGSGNQLFISRWDAGVPQGINKILEYDLRHYPDPANDSFIIEGGFDGDKVVLYDILGRPVHAFTMEGSKRFNLSQILSGTYVLQVIREEVLVYRTSIRVVH